MRISDWSSDVCSSDLQGNDTHDEGDGGHQNWPQAQTAGFDGRLDGCCALQFQLAGELHDQDGVLAGQTHQDHQTYLGEDIVVATRQPNAGQRGQYAHGHDKNHRQRQGQAFVRSEEHTSELQSLMRISYAVFCLKKKTTTNTTKITY